MMGTVFVAFLLSLMALRVGVQMDQFISEFFPTHFSVILKYFSLQFHHIFCGAFLKLLLTCKAKSMSVVKCNCFYILFQYPQMICPKFFYGKFDQFMTYSFPLKTRLYIQLIDFCSLHLQESFD